MSTDFEPKNYPNFEALPDAFQNEFKPVGDDGFVGVNAIDDPELAWVEGWVDHNEQAVGGFFDEIAARHMATLAFTTGDRPMLRPLNEAAAQDFAEQAVETQAALDVMPVRIDQTKQLIRGGQIVDPIDLPFVKDVSYYYDQLLVGNVDTPELNEFTTRALSELRERRLLAELAAASEASIEVTLSEKRPVKVILDGNGVNARLDLPFVTDPKLFPVELGPNAVTEILGGELTDKDYLALYDVLVALPGDIGEAMQTYESAAEEWAREVEKTGEQWNDKIVSRHFAASRVMGVFHYADYTDIPVFAINNTVVRRHPALDHLPTPQPYSS